MLFLAHSLDLAAHGLPQSAGTDDALLLAGAAAALACHHDRRGAPLDALACRRYVLAADLAALGLAAAALRPGVVAIDDAAWVELAVVHPVQVLCR